jgi:hypothetical protein
MGEKARSYILNKFSEDNILASFEEKINSLLS